MTVSSMAKDSDAAQSANADRPDHLEKPYPDAARPAAYRERARTRKGIEQIVAFSGSEVELAPPKL